MSIIGRTLVHSKRFCCLFIILGTSRGINVVIRVAQILLGLVVSVVTLICSALVHGVCICIALTSSVIDSAMLGVGGGRGGGGCGVGIAFVERIAVCLRSLEVGKISISSPFSAAPVIIIILLLCNNFRFKSFKL